MEITRKILNLAVAFGIVVLSLSTFIFSIRDNKAVAATPPADGYTPVGTYVLNVSDANREVHTYLCVVGYNPAAKNKIKMLGSSTIPEFQLSGR